MQLTIEIDDNIYQELKNKGISISEIINEFLQKLKKDKYVSDKEQKEIEKIFNSMSKEDKKPAFSKTLEIEL